VLVSRRSNGGKKGKSRKREKKKECTRRPYCITLERGGEEAISVSSFWMCTRLGVVATLLLMSMEEGALPLTGEVEGDCRCAV